jgi:hypothetical protein
LGEKTLNKNMSLQQAKLMIQINQQDATVSQVYYLTFMCGSTCFGRLSAHHQESTTALEASGFTAEAWRLERCWSWSGRLTCQTTTKAPSAVVRS